MQGFLIHRASREEDLEELFRKPIGWGHAWAVHHKSQGKVWVVEDNANKENLLSFYEDPLTNAVDKSPLLGLAPENIYTRGRVVSELLFPTLHSRRHSRSRR